MSFSGRRNFYKLVGWIYLEKYISLGFAAKNGLAFKKSISPYVSILFKKIPKNYLLDFQEIYQLISTKAIYILVKLPNEF